MIAALALLVLAVVCWPAPSLPMPRTARGAAPPPHTTGDRNIPSHHDDAAAARPVREVADAALLIALSLRSGAGVADSLELVAEVSAGPVAHDLDVVATALRWDRSTDEAWGFAHPVWAPVATAMAIAADTGAGPADAVAAAAAELRTDAAHVQESAAARASVLLVIPLGVLFLPAFVATAVVPVVLALATGSLSG